MNSIEMTESEIIETLKRSYLPTILTEGKDDYSVFRHLEDDIDALYVSVMPVGGKSVLLKILERRSELPKEPLFVIDKDLWALTAIPPEYESISCAIFTHGYSIENDVYQDGNLETLLTRAEKQSFSKEISEICLWYAFAVEKIEAGEECSLKHNPHRILAGPGRTMSDKFKLDIGFFNPCADVVDRIKDNYKELLRGKTLLSLLAQHLSRPKRKAKHSFNGLLEIGSAARGPLMRRVHSAAEAHFRKSSGNDEAAIT